MAWKLCHQEGGGMGARAQECGCAARGIMLMEYDITCLGKNDFMYSPKRLECQQAHRVLMPGLLPGVHSWPVLLGTRVHS